MNLNERLRLCKLQDRHRFTRQLAASERDSEQWHQLTEEIQTSCEWVAQRRLRTQMTRIHYPDLPVSDRRKEISNAIRDNQVVVIAGETGSGKTTQLPKICLELGLGCAGVIGHTQPRRLAARTVAARIAEELNGPLGEQVGYQFRFHDQVSDQTQIKVMTDGILLAETQHDRFLEQYEVIIIDEAHERSLNIDFLLGYLKRLLPKRPDLKLIITSATIDVQRFSTHFDDAPVIEVSGRTYPVAIDYRPLHEQQDDDAQQVDLQQGIAAAVDELLRDARQKHDGSPRDMLVFLPGEREIRETADTLRKANLVDVQILPLYARLSLAEQNKIFARQKRAGVSVILATNVAETSVTVPGIGYVIDTGLARISRYSYRSKVQRLPIEPVSQASANQRAGRCGRIAPGRCLRLYSEEDFNNRPAFTDAEIRRTNLAAVILRMLSLKLGDIGKFPFIDPPDSRFINDGFKLLEELGAVNAQRRLTDVGRQLSQLPLDPRMGRMIIESARQNALAEVLVIASALSVQDPRERPLDKQQAADQAHGLFRDEHSDFISLLNLWNQYEEQRQTLSQSQLRKYAKAHFLSYLRMREWRDIHRQLLLSCRQLTLRLNSEPADYRAIHCALLAGLLSHIGIKQEGKTYLGARNRRFQVFPGSALYRKPPKWLMAAELVETTQLYARTVARIEPEWAEPLAGPLLKRTYQEPAWHKKSAQVKAIEQVTLYGLLIIPKRSVNYGKIDRQTAHEIFIRSALVEGHYQSKAGFFIHNQQLLTQIENLEAKSRRKDLLVDEETLYEFYYQRMAALQGAHICNGAGFERWRKQIEAGNPEALYLTEADLLQRSTEHVSRQAYPDFLSWKGVQLPLIYQFEPGNVADGVTLAVPLALLGQLPLQRIEWLVPGMLQDKCAALLKGLPKQQRKHYVPVPDYAKALAESLVFAQGDWYQAVSHQLLRMTGVSISVEALQAVQLDDHWRMNIRLVDDAGKIIDQSRDPQQLMATYRHLAEQEVAAAPGPEWGKRALTQWDFGDLPTSVTLEQGSGIEIAAWPALQDHGSSVELLVVADLARAEQLTRQGVIRLAWLALATPIRQARSVLAGKTQTSLLAVGKLYSRKQLENAMIEQAIATLLQLDEQGIPRQQEIFLQRLAHVRQGLIEQVKQLNELLSELHQSYHRIQRQLSGQINLSAVMVLNDIKTQLTDLIHPGYIEATPWQYLQHYPRYLAAIELRLEKFARELPRQKMLSEQLQQWRSQYEQLQASLQARGQMSAAVQAFRWLLEEYRVSLFAQQLGTLESVSEKRLRQRWQALQSDPSQ